MRPVMMANSNPTTAVKNHQRRESSLSACRQLSSRRWRSTAISAPWSAFAFSVVAYQCVDGLGRPILAALKRAINTLIGHYRFFRCGQRFGKSSDTLGGVFELDAEFRLLHLGVQHAILDLQLVPAHVLQ